MTEQRRRRPRSSLPLLRRLVLEVFSDGAEATRAEVAAQTGLSRTVVAGVLDELLAGGDLVAAARTARAASGPGRPATAYRLAALVPPVALVRLGHPNRPARVMLVGDGTPPAGTVELEWNVPWMAWSAALHDAVRSLEDVAGSPARCVVVSAPFPVREGAGAPEIKQYDPKPAPRAGHSFSPLTFPDWLEKDPRPALAGLFGRPTLLVNDANLAALGEAHFGAGRGHRHVLHLLVRDGVGAGLVFDGELFTGANGVAGELAHVQVVESGPYCPCGNRGCLTTQTLAPSVVDAVSDRCGRPLTEDEVDRLVSGDDADVVGFFTDLGALVARPLAPVVTVLDPDVVVVDSRLGSAGGPFTDGLRAELSRRCMPSLSQGIDVVGGELADPVAMGARAAADAYLISTRFDQVRAPVPE